MKLSTNIEELLEITNKNIIPKELDKYINSNEIYDKTFSNRAKVLFIKDKGLYLKISEPKTLKKEYENTLFYNKLGVAGEVIDYISDNNYDYLLVKEVKGENGISNNHMSNPKKLVTSFGEHLRMIHELPFDNCPNIDRTKLMLEECNRNVREDKIDMDNFFNKYGFTPNKGLIMLDSLKFNCVNDVFIHGDYYLPNIIMDDYKFSGIVDMDMSGKGDRHFDIISGLKSIAINLKSKEYDDLFLDAYGRDVIDKDRLAFAKLLFILSQGCSTFLNIVEK